MQGEEENGLSGHDLRKRCLDRSSKLDPSMRADHRDMRAREIVGHCANASRLQPPSRGHL